MKAIPFSGYQHAMALDLAKLKTLSVAEAGGYNQTTFGSFIEREYIIFNRSSDQFEVTDKLHDDLKWYDNADIMRHIDSSVLSCFFYRKFHVRLPDKETIRAEARARREQLKATAGSGLKGDGRRNNGRDKNRKSGKQLHVAHNVAHKRAS